MNIKKYAFSICIYIFLKIHKNLNYSFWYLLWSFASVFFFRDSHYSYIEASLPIFSISQFHANPLGCLLFKKKMPSFSYSIFL